LTNKYQSEFLPVGHLSTSVDKQYMWKLSSGKFVEEELYKLGKGLEFEQFVFMHVIMLV